MPGRDGTGPMGNGPKTGRGMNMAENQQQDKGEFQGMRIRQGRGMGRSMAADDSRGCGRRQGAGRGRGCGRKHAGGRNQERCGTRGFGRGRA
ncbi:hypothetical protein L3Q72_21530 [Vibrio sp. JC009]|uniref:hypothetical protein n=1 Tax=Vibrio sp. JC009 TaxID=2912314 RepID=UPI0023AF5500|nr:hypothetical protein [Vibrio sp. JC009]WED23817.1 hypothetical protein L3Q72_21530 [Vibrio sp. JC009]